MFEDEGKGEGEGPNGRLASVACCVSLAELFVSIYTQSTIARYAA